MSVDRLTYNTDFNTTSDLLACGWFLSVSGPQCWRPDIFHRLWLAVVIVWTSMLRDWRGRGAMRSGRPLHKKFWSAAIVFGRRLLVHLSRLDAFSFAFDIYRTSITLNSRYILAPFLGYDPVLRLRPGSLVATPLSGYDPSGHLW